MKDNKKHGQPHATSAQLDEAHQHNGGMDTQQVTAALQRRNAGDDSALVTREEAFGALFAGDPEAMRQLQDLMHEVDAGFGDLTKPGDILKRNEPFTLIDAITTELLDDQKHEYETKHIFKLQFQSGEVVNMMQSTSTIRAKYADLFKLARYAGKALEVGPMQLTEKAGKNIQPAIIFKQLPGCRVREAAVSVAAEV